ncbi:MAG TPA: hypothetical protein VGF18_08630 [Candidatus Tumulicola sp.]
MRTHDATALPSAIQPNAKKGALLYISDYVAGTVSLYSYPKLKPVGMLTGFSAPEGMCVDAASNVWVVDTGASKIVEYAHGATKPTTTLLDPGFFPVSCSVNPQTGDLAVGNIFTTRSVQPGNIALYKNASGSPSYYTTKSSGIYSVYFMAYDPKGNLFFDGANAQPSDGSFIYAEIPKKSNDVKVVTLTGAVFGFPGGVAWDGKHIAVGDQDNAVVYQTQGSKIVGSTPLTGSVDVVGYAISGKTLVGPDGAKANAGVYDYAAGGSPTKVLSGFSDPLGAAISP